MKRRINFTGRVRIPRENVTITGIGEPGEPGNISSFCAEIKLDDMRDLPDDAAVFLDAYHRTMFKRFCFGTVGRIIPPPDTRLGDLGQTTGLKFRLIVVSTTSGKRREIIAAANNIRLQGTRRPILEIRYSPDLGCRLWKLEFDVSDNDPIALVLNESVPNVRNLAKNDPAFFAYVLPAVFAQVLQRMLLIDGVKDPDQPDCQWHADWLVFARQFTTKPVPANLDCDSEDFNEEEVASWIDSVVDGFTRHHSGKWERFLASLGRMESGE